MLKIFISGILAIGIVLLIVINSSLYFTPEHKIIQGDLIQVELSKQLNFLNKCLDHQADQEMQNLYPEGYVFMNALHSLAWINVLEHVNSKSSVYKKGHEEVEKAFGRINSGTGRAIFDETLPLPFGAFYTGWSSYILGKKLAVEPFDKRDSIQVEYFKKQCRKISLAIKQRTYPATYYGSVWPADVTLCVASLAIHDQLFTPLYTSDIQKWIASVNAILDSNGLIPHSINYTDQTVAEEARGSSQSLMLIFLKEIDPDFATQQFIRYKEKFLDTRLGLTGIREYPKGTYGMGDVDSGPVILHMGGAATIVGMQTFEVYGEPKTSHEIRSTLEALGLPFEKNDERFYLFGLLPMADAFIAWSYSRDKDTQMDDLNFLAFHLYSTTILILLLAMLWWLWRKRKLKKQAGNTLVNF